MALLAASCDPFSDGPGASPGPKGAIWKCVVPADSVPGSSPAIGCVDDYRAMAAHPLDASLPGAFAVKTVIDRADGDKLYFVDTRKYLGHYDFVATRLSGNGKPVVPSIFEFNQTEYYTPDRRFILGTLGYYEGPRIWTWEMTPSDNAGADMMALAFGKVAAACFCGKDLYLHATSLAIEAEARKMPGPVKILPTAALHGQFAYQALNYATAIGRLSFATAAQLPLERLGPGDIVVLDSAPADLPWVGGLVTREFQSPLSPLNALARDRGIPNMALRGSDSSLRSLEGKWAKLTVGPFEYSLSEATEAEADAWRDAHQPAAVAVPGLDTSAKDLREAEGLLDADALGLGEALAKAIPLYGATASHFAAFARMDPAKVKFRKAFAIPVSYYRQHMRESGLDDSVDAMLADPAFQADPAVRERRLAALRAAIEAAPIDSAFWSLLIGTLDERYPGTGTFLLRPSSNAEDLGGFTGEGLYGPRIGGRADGSASLRKALLEVWSGTWAFRAFEERSFRNIDHKAVGTGLLVQEAPAGAEASGTAVTANLFDQMGFEPGFYVNARPGDIPLSGPEPYGACDQFIYHYGFVGQPIVLLARSDRVAAGETVLTRARTYALGEALAEIHRAFQPVYGEDASGLYGMEAEFRWANAAGDAPGAEPVLFMEGVRPYHGWKKW